MTATSERLLPTPSQTAGPYLAIGLLWPDGPNVVPDGTPGAIRIAGRLLDGAGEPVGDGMVEIWQADPDGHYPHPEDPGATTTPADPAAAAARADFRGFGRCLTGPDGSYSFRTVKPGRVPDLDGGWQAPHLAVSVFARGVLKRLATRLYFADEEAANAEDALLRSLPAEARASLVARPAPDGYVLDLRLRGAAETTFFAV